MTTLAVVAAIFGAGAIITLIGARLIERAHRPRGRFIDVGVLRQHVIELDRGADAPGSSPPVVLQYPAPTLATPTRTSASAGPAAADGHRVGTRGLVAVTT